MRPENEPDLMRLYLRHCAIGFVLSAVFVAVILWRDVAGLGSLIAGSDVGYLAVFLLWFFNGTVFGSVQFAIVVMSQADDDDDDDHRGPLIPIRVEARASRGS
ncbi:hypothetical protein AN191_15165 [Loktanella sp. 5RATIMAR09]|uniref:hypothetical protein n=1 Tax=Loktanella sp. 5RATIMAR09 TaxID=1225655 RepID=UPI0006EB61CF|nr:hypothetical protein [Loktanella sp. 5RATIMAR09]KQI71038.1 hypothetical protein AN191_15165 [Loktanella sp. 5RATIMAR09]